MQKKKKKITKNVLIHTLCCVNDRNSYFSCFISQVTVDEGSSLEHVTRTRPKGNRGRRPPTRIHMKEVRYNCFTHAIKPS